jgi:hypothetical protein
VQKSRKMQERQRMTYKGTREAFSWGTFDEVFLNDLAGYLQGRRVLETFAGNGLLAHHLRQRGVNILGHVSSLSCQLCPESPPDAGRGPDAN